MKITIVITAHNRPEGLERSLQSVRAAGLPCVVVSSGTKERPVIEGHRGEFRLVEFQNDPGNNAAWIAGVRAAETPYVMVLHDDDWLESDAFSKRLPEMESAMDAGAGFIGWQTRIHSAGSQTIHDAFPIGLRQCSRLLSVVMSGPRTPSPGCGLHRKEHLLSALEEFQISCTEDVFKVTGNGTMVSGNDLLIWLRACERFQTWHKINEPLVNFTADDASTTVSQMDPNSRMHLAYKATRDYFSAHRKTVRAGNPDLRNTTCVQIEALFPDRAARVLNWCAECCAFEDVILFSPRPPNVPFVGRWIQIPKFGYVGYSTFSTKCLHYYVKSEFALVTQHDGFIIHPENWSDEFFEYDYIGAPWPASFGGERVGNSGFSLRSQAFMQACAELAIPHNNETDEPEARRYGKGVDAAADDIWMCKNPDVREALGRMGIQYAPLDVAMYFAMESGIEEMPFDDSQVFGFHDFSYREGREKYKKLVGWTEEKEESGKRKAERSEFLRTENQRSSLNHPKLTPGKWGR